MSPTNYLPKLKPGTQDRVITPEQPGVWNDRQGQNRLMLLSDALDDQSKNAKVRSIPDPWARAILFTRALFNRDHRLHAQTLGEWRGLLALLGLKEIRGFTELTAQPVSLGDVPEGGFLSTLARMLPPRTQVFAREGNWEQFHLLRWAGERGGSAARVFGMTSPTALVMTGAWYADVFRTEDVPWFLDGLLTDPAGADAQLSGPEKRWLREWVLHVRSQLRDLEPGNETRHGALLELLEEFAADLKPDLKPDLGTGAVSTAPEEILSEFRLGLHSPRIYASLDRPHRRQAPTLTDLRIVTDNPKSEGKVFLLYDPGVVTPMDRPERDITFYETDTLASAPRRYPVREGRSGELRRDGSGEVHWCNKGFFFADDLIYDQVETWAGSSGGGNESFPGCRPVITRGDALNRYIALPLTEDAARLFTPRYLAENFSIEWLRGGGARCRLRLALTSLPNPRQGERIRLAVGGDQARVTVEIEHVYGERDMNRIKGEVMPLVCVWPNFQCPDEPGNDRLSPGREGFRNRWKRYYLFEGWSGVKEATELEMTPLDLPAENRREVRQQNGMLQVVTATSRFPEVLVCRMPFTNKPRRNDNNPPRGLLLLREPERIAPQFGSGSALGIDFGTTGTSIYRARLTGNRADAEVHEIGEMIFRSRVVQVTARAQHEVKDLTRHHFIPSAMNPSGRMLSVFQVKGTETGTADLLNGHVLFQSADTAANVPSPFVWGEPNTIVINLKWGTNTRETDAAESFLSQLCIQSLAELVADGTEWVDVRFSYPTAFDDADLERFNGLWRSTLDEVGEVTSVPVTASDTNPDNYEAVAAMRYFAERERLRITAGAVMLDIGGGTTDIAFWNLVGDEPALVAHSSVLFAGTNMFQAALREKQELLQGINRTFPLPSLQQAKYPAAYFAELDALIAAHGSALLPRLPRAVEESDAAAEFIHILEIGLSGIAFYTGLLLGNLIAEGRYEVGDTDRIQVFVGGNASRLLDWCDLGDFKKNSVFYRTFGEAVLTGARLSAADKLGGKSIEITQSRDPKHEVAFGLVCKVRGIRRESEYASPPAGEDFSAGDDLPHSWGEAPDLGALTGKKLKINRKLPVFTRFLEFIGEDLTPHDRDGLVDSANDALKFMADTAAKQAAAPPRLMRNRKAGAKSNPVRNQPLFILLLKKLVELRIAEMGKR